MRAKVRVHASLRGSLQFRRTIVLKIVCREHRRFLFLSHRTADIAVESRCGDDNAKNKIPSATRIRRKGGNRAVVRLRCSRFPRIATFATQIRLRNAAPGGGYADPSTHISGIVHSCPHLGYLNYICNAYRGTVGTKYVGASARPQRLHMRDTARVVVVVVVLQSRVYVRTGIYSPYERSHRTRARPRAVLRMYKYVYVRARVFRRCVSMFAPSARARARCDVGVRRIEFRVCKDTHKHAANTHDVIRHTRTRA